MEKTKLQKTAEHLEYMRRILVNGIWIAIILVILASLGWFFLGSQQGDRGANKAETPAKIEKAAQPAIDWQQVDKVVAESLISARQDARRYAEGELDTWISAMMERVDNSFLDWYFNYWTQQVLGLKGLYQYGVHYVLESQPTASEKLTEEIQSEFSQRVLQPQIAQKILERIVNETAARYVNSLKLALENVPVTYGISKIEWQSYLEDIAITSKSSEGGRQTPLTLKAITVSGVGGVALMAGHLKAMVSKIGGKILTKSTGKVASKMAVKTGGKVVAKVGGKFFGTIAGLGVLVWDIWDHNATERENRPFLRQSLQDYFVELKAVLLDDPDFGIMTTFNGFEQEISKRNSSTQTP